MLNHWTEIIVGARVKQLAHPHKEGEIVDLELSRCPLAVVRVDGDDRDHHWTMRSYYYLRYPSLTPWGHLERINRVSSQFRGASKVNCDAALTRHPEWGLGLKRVNVPNAYYELYVL